MMNLNLRRIGLSILFRISKYWKDDPSFLKVAYYLWTGRVLDLKHPMRFTEKIQWLKLYNRKPEYVNLVDKYEVKKIVSKIIGSSYIIPTIAIFDNTDEIDLDKLPEKFVIKATKGGGGNSVFICKDKRRLEFEKIKSRLEKTLSSRESCNFRERNYDGVKPRVIVEQYMQNGSDSELTDYKFYCFNGKAEYCQVIANRRVKETIDFFDRDWNHMPFIGLNPKCTQAVEIHPKPKSYDEMLAIAEKLSIGIPFVRVDLYYINDKIYFGEMTFYPASGFGSFTPDEWDYKLGNLIELPL